MKRISRLAALLTVFALLVTMTVPTAAETTQTDPAVQPLIDRLEEADGS